MHDFLTLTEFMATEQSNEQAIKDLSEKAGVDEELAADPVFASTRRTIIRFGNIFFILCGFAIFVPMLVGVGQGIANEQVWDPYTNRPVFDEAADTSCVDGAVDLLGRARALKTLERNWAEPSREWTMRCRAKHPKLYDALLLERERLSKGE